MTATKEERPVGVEWESAPGRSLLPHPYETLEEWVRRLETKKQEVFRSRIADPAKPRTLAEIARDFGVTRERIRQMESEILEELGEFARTRMGRTVALMADAARETLGPAAPRETAEELLRPPAGTPDHLGAILALAGGYASQKDGWILRVDAKATDPTQKIVDETPKLKTIDTYGSGEMLKRWGLREPLHERWLLRHESIVRNGRKLIRKGRDSASNRLKTALERMERPASVEELMEHLRDGTSRGTVNNAARNDPEITRVGRSQLALTCWELPEYLGVFRSMVNIIQQQGGEYDVQRLHQAMWENFGVNPSTTQAYLYTPTFVHGEGLVRLRTESDAPFEYTSRVRIQGVGTYELGEGKSGIAKRISRDILRGSWSGITRSAGRTLGIEPGDDLTFRDDRGRTVGVGLLNSNISGPSLKSVRGLLDNTGAVEGDWLTLVLCRPGMSMRAEVVRAGELRRDWETIGRLTGLGERAGPRSLARAMNCSPGETREALRRRGAGSSWSAGPGNEIPGPDG